VIQFRNINISYLKKLTVIYTTKIGAKALSSKFANYSQSKSGTISNIGL
jgi:hypothetical protein